jgi:hypothetical protein
MHPALIHAISGMDTSLVLLIYSGWAILVDWVAMSAPTVEVQGTPK